jgi:hypothetical protein
MIHKAGKTNSQAGETLWQEFLTKTGGTVAQDIEATICRAAQMVAA